MESARPIIEITLFGVLLALELWHVVMVVLLVGVIVVYFANDLIDDITKYFKNNYDNGSNDTTTGKHDEAN